MQNNKNILIATTLSLIVLLGWTWFYEKPRLEQKEFAQRQFLKQQKLQQQEVKKAATEIKTQEKGVVRGKNLEEILVLKDKNTIIDNSKSERIKISSDNLHGSISLRGARFDDLTLAKYFETTKKEKEVTLFAPSDSKERYFADFGWISSNAELQLPNPNTLWKTSAKELSPKNPITLSWNNAQNVEFIIHIALDENYMFSVEQEVKNNSGKEISVASYGRINRALNNMQKSMYILHEGMIGSFNDILEEVTYKDLIEDKTESFAAKGGWLGITDKYWLSSILPDKSLQYDASFDYKYSNKNNIFNAEFVGQEYVISANESQKFSHHLFAGAKKVRLLDKYSKDYDVNLFDRAVDFGWFYFLTKPFFYMISFLSKLFGNFGLAILAMTVIVKLVLFPMANKSYLAIARIKKLQPKIVELKKRHEGDRLGLNKEMMSLYKKEGVNPASGCLPVIVQIPIFFALYKVLFVTIDMRHAPFYGWIHDLSMPDPTSIFNLFGLLPFSTGSSFTIGIWPILMGLTMFLQQKISPASSDPIQAKVLKWMPVIMVFILAPFPAGLVIYWTWSNGLSILQQYIITKKLNKS